MTTTEIAIPAPDGLYPDISDLDYHADKGSLSSSGARKMLAPSCPAIFRHEQRRPPKPLPQFDFGHLAHKFVLGVGNDVDVVQADDWRTKAAKEQRDESHTAGRIPVLNADYVKAMAMKQAVREHPTASVLLTGGQAELSGYHRDSGTGVRLRYRLDYLSAPDEFERTTIVDYKTSTSADPAHFAKAAANYGYHQQAAWYLDGLEANGQPAAAFVFVVQSKTAPYLVSVVQLDDAAITEGRRLNRQAIDLYAQCKADDHWPAYGDGIIPIRLPSWALRAGIDADAQALIAELEGIEA